MKVGLRYWFLPLLVAAQSVAAQNYPAKPVRLIVPFAAGGGTDLVGRTIAQKLTEAWGQTFVVENRGGAGGVIGAELVAKSPPDGYTLAGQLQVLFDNLPVVQPHVRSGKLRLMGVGTQTRSALIREAPTIAESGVPGFEASTAFGVLAPARTPLEIVSRFKQRDPTQSAKRRDSGAPRHTGP
jgi:tripartite-type tricarboxylate transporter receptor subunit TctC